MASSNPNLDSSYSRPLNRSLESEASNVARLTEEDRRKVYGLRNIFGEKLNQIQHLEESLAEKDVAIEREIELRRNLEDKLLQSGLVDMYGDPAVVDELNERLPRGSKSRMHSIHETPKSSKQKQKKSRSSHGAAAKDSADDSSDDDTRKHHSTPYYPSQYMIPPGFTPPVFPYGFTMMPQSLPLNGERGPMHPMAAYSFPMMSQNNLQTENKENMASAPGNKSQEQDTHVLQAASLLSADSKERQIARLLHTIDQLKDQNHKLSSELTEKMAENDKLKVEKDLLAATSREETTSRVTALIQEIREKQKQRDQAMLGRMKLANEERDRALAMLNSIRQNGTIAEMVSADDSDLNQSRSILRSLDIEHDASDVLNAIHGSAYKNRETSSAKIRALTEERDRALIKVTRLEREVMTLQRQVEETTPLYEELEKLKKQLSNTQQERDMALTKLSGLEEENNTLKIYYGLHEALSKEQQWKDQYNNSLSQMKGRMIDAQKETNQLQAIIQELTHERDVLLQENDKYRFTQDDHLKNNQKLQRQVHVLQKKLKVMGDPGVV